MHHHTITTLLKEKCAHLEAAWFIILKGDKYFVLSAGTMATELDLQQQTYQSHAYGLSFKLFKFSLRSEVCVERFHPKLK